MRTRPKPPDVGQAVAAKIIPFPRSTTRVSDPEGLLRLIGSIPHPGLRHYCVDRIRTARSLEDVAATVDFVHQVTGTEN